MKLVVGAMKPKNQVTIDENNEKIEEVEIPTWKTYNLEVLHPNNGLVATPRLSVVLPVIYIR